MFNNVSPILGVNEAHVLSKELDTMVLLDLVPVLLAVTVLEDLKARNHVVIFVVNKLLERFFSLPSYKITKSKYKPYVYSYL